MPRLPVQKEAEHDLCTITQEVIKNVVTASYRIVASISYNNVINRKIFIELSVGDGLIDVLYCESCF